jgi:hypothetical protein
MPLKPKQVFMLLEGKRRRVPKFPLRNHKNHGSKHIWPGNSSAWCVGGIAVRWRTPGMAVARAATTKILRCILRPPWKKEKIKKKQKTGRHLLKNKLAYSHRQSYIRIVFTADFCKRVVLGDLLLHLLCELLFNFCTRRSRTVQTHFFSFCTAQCRPGTKTEQ